MGESSIENNKKDTDMAEEEIKTELSKDFYQPDLLSRFKINSRKRKSDISAIVPTYNRCPLGKDSEDYKYNPLFLCIKALMMQKSPINEIIVVDDASTDHTESVVQGLVKEAYSTKGVNIKYFRNSERKGSSVSRNIAAKHASSKFLFFLDDDCIPVPYLTFVSMIAIKALEKTDKNFSVLVLPVYDRASFPKIAVKKEDLARTFFKRGNTSASLNSIPAEYLKTRGNFLNKDLQIFKPIQVFQTWGHFVADRSKYLDVGGFPDFATWPNKAGEEQELACRLVENAYTLYYLPDPKASSYHGAYGAKIGPFEGKDWLHDFTEGEFSLVKFSDVCENGIKSGNRVSPKVYFYSRIISTFCVIYKRNIKEAINWAKGTYDDFVSSNNKEWYPRYAKEPIDSRRVREKIWHKAIRDGLSLLMGVEQKKVAKLSGFIASLRHRGRLEEEAQKHILRNKFKGMIKKFSKKR